MRIIYALLLFVGVSVAAFSQSAAPNLPEAASKTPFTLEITPNRDIHHSENWDFVNSSEIVVKAGSIVELASRKTNISDREINVWSDPPYQWEVRDNRGYEIKARKYRPGDEMHPTEALLVGTKEPVLQPGESKIISSQVTNTFEELNEPGTYTIQVSEHISDDPASEIIKSNIVKVTVLPADDEPPEKKHKGHGDRDDHCDEKGHDLDPKAGK